MGLEVGEREGKAAQLFIGKGKCAGAPAGREPAAREAFGGGEAGRLDREQAGRIGCDVQTRGRQLSADAHAAERDSLKVVA